MQPTVHHTEKNKIKIPIIRDVEAVDFSATSTAYASASAYASDSASASIL